MRILSCHKGLNGVGTAPYHTILPEAGGVVGGHSPLPTSTLRYHPTKYNRSPYPILPIHLKESYQYVF